MTFTHPHFAEPRWLCLAVLGPIALALLHAWSAWARKRQLARFASASMLADVSRSHSPTRRFFKNALLCLAMAAFGLALARPQWGEQREHSETFGEDVVFIFDCSRSMLASDVAPSRMQRAKLAVLDFIHQRWHGRVGLVAFAGTPFLQCPLTFSYDAFEETLMSLDDKTIPVPGSDIGGALEEGFRALDKEDRKKLLILITDGEDTDQGAVRTAEALAKKGVVIFTIGVGTPPGAEIQIVNEQGQRELLRDSKGEVHRSRLDELTLRGIAEATHGSYFSLGSIGEDLSRVRLALQNMDASGPAQSRKFGVERFHVFVAIIIVLLIAEPLISTRRRKHI